MRFRVNSWVEGLQAQVKTTLIGSKKRASIYTSEKKEKSEYGTDFYPFRSAKGP